MRLLERDRRLILIARFEALVQQKDDQGRLLGRYETNRSEQEAVMCNVSAAKGQTDTQIFGQACDYDKTIIIDDPDFEVNESSVFWIDTTIEIEVDDKGIHRFSKDPHDYVVAKIARTPNVVAIAVKKAVGNEKNQARIVNRVNQ